MITITHSLGKRIRIRGAPATPDCRKALTGLGADIINTDHVKACRKFLRMYHY